MEKTNNEKIMELARELAKKKKTREESLESLVSAGILNRDGNFTEPYAILGTYFVSK